MPVSATLKRSASVDRVAPSPCGTYPCCSETLTVTAPRSEYFTALLIRFNRTCSTRRWSPWASPTAGSTDSESANPFFSASGRIAATAFSTTARTS